MVLPAAATARQTAGESNRRFRPAPPRTSTVKAPAGRLIAYSVVYPGGSPLIGGAAITGGLPTGAGSGERRLRDYCRHFAGDNQAPDYTRSAFSRTGSVLHS